jgi:hypothetical protein
VARAKKAKRSKKASARRAASRSSSSADVTRRLSRIEAHLTKLSKFMRRYNWRDVVKRKPAHGGEKGGSTPPRWPP